MPTSGPPRAPALALPLVLLAAGAEAAAQTTVQIPLNYNFNGIVHAGEAGRPDDLNGFRSISDRALDFRGGVPNHPLLNRYQLVGSAGALDIVHLGNRNQVDGGNWQFDANPDGDNVGIRPNWLPNPNQSTPQRTTLATPVAIGPSSVASLIFQISNGGGTFDVTFGYASGASRPVNLGGGDWFNGAFAGTDSVDQANSGNNLNIVEQMVDLSGDAGESLTSITFSNPSNPRAGYAILAVNVEAAPDPSRLNHIALSCNFNGIVHAGESGAPDASNGFRSISDRALDFRAGVPNDNVLSRYQLVSAAGVPDLVHLGNRNTVSGGQFAFDAAPNGNDIGVRPAWLANPDQTGVQRTTLAEPILLDASSEATFLFQISNGGGLFDVTFVFGLGTQGSITATLDGADWFGGPYAGTDRIDAAGPGAGLRISESRVDLSAAAGFVLTAIEFSNSSNPDAGIAVLAANVIGCLACANQGAVADLGGASSTGATLSVAGPVPLGCELAWEITGATPSAPAALFGLSLTTRVTPLSVLFSSCDGTVHLDRFLTAPLQIGPAGGASFELPLPTDPTLCGMRVYSQYLEAGAGACPVLVSNALAITIGN